jgi:ATP-binding cassette subfamily B protein
VTAFVGPTGAGKTTLVSLITRLYDPSEGAVLIDGVDIREYTLRSLRSQISVVLQESVLFHASIGDNIAYGRERATMDEIVAAAKLANAHEFISALEKGYETEVGERGDTLSGGQRQRIAIARAMVRNAPILILDEPLTGLDADSAAAVLEALERLVAGRTSLFITHQLYNVQHAHSVVVLDGGRIVQQGAHAELIGADGRYRSLFQAQTREVPQFRDVTAARS